MSNRKTKTPEQLQIGDIVPVWGDDIKVTGIVFTDIKHTRAGDRTSNSKMAEVSFNDGSVAFYPPGSQIAVVTE